MKKKSIAMILVAALCVSMLGGITVCGNGWAAETTDVADAGEDAKIVNAYYAFTRDVGFSYDNFFHFYEDFVYVGFAVNQVTSIYSYEVVEEEMAYACYADADALGAEGELTEGTAPYTVNFYNMETGELVDSCAFDGDILYNDMDVITFQGAGHVFYTYDEDPENSALAATYEGEVGSVVFEAVNPDDETGTLALYHTGKYLDMVNMMIEGTFEVTEDGYVLTPDSDGDPVVTVTVNKNRTCTYAPEGEEELVMNVLTAEAVPAYYYTADIEVSGMAATLTITMYDDMTFTAEVGLKDMDMVQVIDSGTYEISEAYAITLHGEIAGDITGSDYTGDLQYVQAGTAAGDIDVVCTFAVAAEAVPAYYYTADVEVSGMAATLTITMYDDMTFTAEVGLKNMDMVQTIDSGTYEISEAYAITLHGEIAGDMTGSNYTGDLQYVQAGTAAGDIDVVCTFAVAE